jgi:uncharacterized membrane protein
MRGLAVFVVFFAIFLVSSLLISSPLFPGNIFCFLLRISDSSYVSLASAAMNGLFYGFLVWVVFSLSFRWVERSLDKNKTVRENKQPSTEQ